MHYSIYCHNVKDGIDRSDQSQLISHTLLSKKPKIWYPLGLLRS